MAAPDVEVKTLLDAVASPESLASGYTLFLGPEQPVEDGYERVCVFVLDTGGGSSERFLGTSTDYRTHSIQVVVRANHYDYTGGQALAAACWSKLNCASISGYVYCLPQQSGPAYVGEDEQRMHRWSINVTLARTV